MTQTASDRPTVRKVSLNLPNKEVRIMEDLAEDLQITRTEVIRRALRNEKYIQEILGRGAKLLIKDKDSDQLREVVFR